MPVRRLARLIFKVRANSRSGGILSPGCSVPFSISERMWLTTCIVRWVFGSLEFIRGIVLSHLLPDLESGGKTRLTLTFTLHPKNVPHSGETRWRGLACILVV